MEPDHIEKSKWQGDEAMSWDILPKAKLQYVLQKLKDTVLGTAAYKNVGTGVDNVIIGSDSRLSDARNAADVYSWAKAETKPSYTASEVGAIPDSTNIKTVTGNPIDITDGSETYAESLAVQLAPKQDLHGYDHPWVGGAGYNKLNYDEWSQSTVANGTGVWENNGVTLTATYNNCFTYSSNYNLGAIDVNEGDTVIVSWEESTNASGMVYLFDQSGNVIGYGNNDTVKSLSITIASGISSFRFRFGVNASGVTISYRNIMVQRNTNETAYASYSNICPIMGYTTAEVGDVGKNLFDINSLIVGGINNIGQDWQTGNQGYRRTPFIFVSAGEYTIKRIGNTDKWWKGYFYNDADQYAGTGWAFNTYEDSINTFNVTSDCWLRIAFDYAPSTEDNIQLEKGSSSTTYEPYTTRNAFIQLGNINRWDEQWANGYWYDIDGTWHGDSRFFASKNKIPVSPNTSYYFKAPAYQFEYCAYAKDGSFLRFYNHNLFSYDSVITTKSDEYYIAFNSTNVNDLTTYDHNIGINYPSTVTEYYPYDSNKQDMIFGCTVDMHTGIATVLYGYDGDLGAVGRPWWAEEDGMFRTELLDSKYFGTLYCSRYKGVKAYLPSDGEIAVTNSQAYQLLRIKDPTCVGYTAVEFSNHISGCQLAYELGSPFTLQLTPDELKLLKQTNRLTTNGTTINLTYQPDNPLGDVLQASEEYTDRQVDRLDSDVSGKVSKSGDTMTGVLTLSEMVMNGANGRRFREVLDAGNKSNVDIGWDYANQDGSGIGFRSSDIGSVLYLFSRHPSNGTNAISMTPNGDLISYSDLGTKNLARANRSAATGSEDIPVYFDANGIAHETNVDVKSTQTVTGNPIYISDAAPMRAESLVVDFLPKQDLHGYGFPWVGGCGKNKLPLDLATIKSLNTSGTWSGNAYTLYDVTFTVNTDDGGNVTGIKVNGTNASGVNSFIRLYENLIVDSNMIISGTPNGSGTTYLIEAYASSVPAWYSDASGASGANIPPCTLNSIDITVRGGQTVDFLCEPMICLATAQNPTVFERWSNICPITGYTECDVDDVGKNWFNSEIEEGAINSDDGEPFYVSDRYRTKNYISVLPSTHYIFGINGTEQRENWFEYDENYNYIGRINYVSNFITSAQTRYVKCYGTNELLNNSTLQLEKGITATTYEPYHSSNATIQFGQTVYGGSVDVTDGGTDDDRASVDLGSLTWTKDGNDFLSSELSVLMRRPSSVSEAANMLCECFDVKAQSNFETKNGTIAYFYTNSSESVSKVVVYLVDTSLQDFMTIVNGQKLVYEKATLTTIQTPPTELKLLKGTNNLTTNGTTITLGYQPDNVIGEVKSDFDNWVNENSDCKVAVGKVVEIENVAGGYPEELIVDFEPQQDFHGYRYPWIGGAGKNKLPMTVDGLKTLNSSTGTWSDNVFTREECTFEVLTDSDNNVIGIKVNAPSSHNTATFSFGDFSRISGTTYILNGCPANGTTSSYKLRWNDVGYDYGNGITTDGTAGTGTVAIDIMSNTAVTDLIFRPMIRLSTETDPTFEPYTNICTWPFGAISQHPAPTQCWVESVGKNKIPMTFSAVKAANTDGSWDSYTYTINGLTYKVSVDDYDNVIGIGVSGNGAGVNSLFWLPSCDILNEPLILNGCNGGSNSTYFIQIYRPDGETTITQYGGNDVLYTPTVENQAYLCVEDGVYLNYSVWFYPMIRKANIKDNTFEPYKYSRGELNFNDYLDQVKVNMTTGIISCDTETLNVGNKSWTYVGAPYYLFYCDIPKLALGEKIISSGFKQTHVSDPLLIQNGEVWNESSEFGQHNLVVKDLRYDNVSDFRTGNNDILFNVKREDEYITIFQKIPTKFRLIDGYNTIKTNGAKIWIKYLTGDINKNVSKMAYNTARIQPDYYHTYNSISHTFTTTKKTFNYYDIEHCLDMIEDTRQKLESAIKDHSNLIVWTSIKTVDSTSGVAVNIPASAAWVKVVLYANVDSVVTVCGHLEYPTASNSNKNVELHGTVGSTDYYVTGKTTGNKTWYVSTNAYAQVYYHK